MNVANDKTTEFKDRVNQDWAVDETAAAWQKHYHTKRTQLAAVTQTLLDAADLRPGLNVLDLASGPGEPALTIAKIVSPGRVTATDLSEAMLAALRFNANDEGLTNVEARLADGESLPFPDESFDRVTSRFGAMFFVEIDKALAEVRRVLNPGGRATFVVWGAPIPGTYFGSCVVPYTSRLDVKPDPDAPGPMRFAEPGKLAKLMDAAGFLDVQERYSNLPAPWPAPPEAMLAAVFELAAPLRNAVADLPVDVRMEAEQEALANLYALYDGQQVAVTAPTIVVTGKK